MEFFLLFVSVIIEVIFWAFSCVLYVYLTLKRWVLNFIYFESRRLIVFFELFFLYSSVKWMLVSIIIVVINIVGFQRCQCGGQR